MMTKFLTLELAIEFYHLIKNYKFHNRVMQDQFNRALLSIIHAKLDLAPFGWSIFP